MNIEDLARDATSRDPTTPLFGIGWHRHADGRWVWGALYGDGCAACDAAWRSAVPGPTAGRWRRL